jgi:hypothetical protein
VNEKIEQMKLENQITDLDADITIGEIEEEVAEFNTYLDMVRSIVSLPHPSVIPSTFSYPTLSFSPLLFLILFSCSFFGFELLAQYLA